MKEEQTHLHRLSDYKAPDYVTKYTELTLDLSKIPIETETILHIEPNSMEPGKDLVLNGQNIKLLSISLDDKELDPSQYEITPESLIIKNIPKKLLRLKSKVQLGINTDLFGLYETDGVSLVKAETEGLRRVFYCMDRPDVLSTYKTTIIANKKDYSCLLSNGISLQAEDLGEQYKVTWYDKVAKPSYLFAMIAGVLEKSGETYTSTNGHKIAIEFFLPPNTAHQSTFAKKVLQAAMHWDEEVYHLYCALSRYIIAGVDKYASGASETTGLNLFNTANLFSSPETTTDLRMLHILEVVSHEFFHYWTGNRVTIKNWFNLCFKEGLTTFRAALFREDLFASVYGPEYGADLVRLLDGKNLDPKPSRPDSYTEVRNLYNAAAYDKSAQIFKMMMLYAGRDVFNKALSSFLKCHDGSAVTLEQLLQFLSDATEMNFNVFLPWFTEEGIPNLDVTDSFDEKTKIYTLKIKNPQGKNRPIPVLMGLLDPSGEEIQANTVLMIDKPEMEFKYEVEGSRPIPSLLRSFSAPVTLNYDYTQEQLLTLIKFDTNSYNRCEAARKLIVSFINNQDKENPWQLNDSFFDAYKHVLKDSSLPPWIKAEIVSLPTEEELITLFDKPDFEKIARLRLLIQKELGLALKDQWFSCYDEKSQLENPDGSKLFDIHAAGIRRLQAVCRTYFQHIDRDITLQKARLQFDDALKSNMTDTLSALSILAEMNDEKLDALLTQYFDYWHHEPNAINSWFALQASIHSNEVINRVKTLTNHYAFDLSNPNHVDALLKTFIKNPYGFHAASGEGYTFIASKILELDKTNPTLAAKLVQNFSNWKSFDEGRKKLMLTELLFIENKSESSAVRNIVKKLLAKMEEYERPSMHSFFQVLKRPEPVKPRVFIEEKPKENEEEEFSLN